MFEPVRQVAVLVGGKGTRLGTLTAATPKPLMAIATGRVFLDYLVENLARQGFDDIVLMAGHFGDQLRQRYDGQRRYGARLRVMVEPEPLGTAGALMQAKDLLAPRFLMANGDTFFDFNARAFATAAAAQSRPAVLALRTVGDGARYGSVLIEGGRIVRFVEKNLAATGAALVSAGTYVIDRALLDRIDTLPASIETGVFPKLVAERQLGGIEATGYFIDIGLPETLVEAQAELPRRTRRPAVFLDRDGVLNHDSGYVHTPAAWRWIDGAQAAVRRINDMGALAIVVTNQAGVAHGYYDESAVLDLHGWVSQELAEVGAYIDAYYHAPFHPDGKVSAYRQDHDDRKPKPGMLLRAMADWPIDRSRSMLIGDRNTDIEAARRAGVTGHLFQGGDLDQFIQAVLPAPIPG